MDKATIIGLTLSALVIFMVMEEGGSGLGLYWNPSAFVLVVFGSIGATICAFPMKDVMRGIDITKKAFTEDAEPVHEIIKTLVRFSSRARREGILSLERNVENIEDPFLRKGIQMAIDGVDPELLRHILEAEISSIEARHETGKLMFEKVGVFGPAFGLMGTLAGLIAMLANMEDPSKMAGGLAVSLLATFYGTVVANWVADPISTKLKKKSEKEIQTKELMLMGILAIQTGDNPAVLEQKLNTFLAPSARKMIEAEK